MKVDFRISGHKIYSWHWQEKSQRYWFYNKNKNVVVSISDCPKPLEYEELVALFSDKEEDKEEDINNSMNKSLDNVEGDNNENANKETL